ncbi:MAG TPA: SDR family oxidoreductase [Chloroflexia bacterium]|nr:SDR family oxidoreductase [Chloroflexia bacterium]
MNYDFKGKVVVVTGGTGGLGRAVAELFKESGAEVVVPQRGDKEGTYHLEASNEESVSAFFEAVVKQYGRVDALVNVIGGYAAGDPVASLDTAVFDSQLELNLKSAFLLTKYAVQKMTGQGGKIVHVGSRAAVDKGVNSFAYSVSKLGVLRLVEAVAEETREQNININAVLPSIIDTPANRQAMPKAHHDRWPKPEQIAKVIAFLASDDAELISGAAIPVYGKA